MRIADSSLGNHVIDITDACFILREIKVKKGKTTETTVGYFTTLESAINKVIKLKLINKNSVVNLTDFVSMYKAEFDKIKNVINSTMSVLEAVN